MKLIINPSGSDHYARASRIAMSHYAKEIKKENPGLARGIKKVMLDEALEAYGFKRRNHDAKTKLAGIPVIDA